MNKIKKFLDSKLYYPFICILSFCFWLIAYLINQGKIDTSDLNYVFENIESISLIVFGVVCAFLLVFFKNTFYFIPWLIFIPFVFARPFDALTIPKTLYIGLGIMGVGLIANIIIYRPKIKVGHFFWGLLILGFAIILGGIDQKNENFGFQLFFTILCMVAFLLIYIVLSSSAYVRFKQVARLFTYLGIFLVLQLTTYFLIQEDIVTSLVSKGSNVGWGISNNIALILLFTIPFTLYLVLTNGGLKTVIYVTLVFIQCIAIVITYSRGAIIALAVGIILLIPFSFWKAQDRKAVIITTIVHVILLAALVILVYNNYNEQFTKFSEIVFKINWEELNGRTPIYEDCIASLKEYPIFGKGLLSMFEEIDETHRTYNWGHSTIFQTIRTMGLVGLIAMIIHLIQKYFVLLRRPTLWKMILLAAFAMSGLYGLFDVSYYFINYMIPLILSMAIVECLFRQAGDDDYEIL